MHVGIVGAGIVGLAHAWSAAERGCRVTVFERSERASGASIRNFGMVWPIGQPPGVPYRTALLSRERWLRLAREAGLWVNPCGSLHLAHRPDELAVIEEFADRAPGLGYDVRRLDAQEVLDLAPCANPAGLLGGLYSATELGVNPLAAIRSLPSWLQCEYGVEFKMNTHVAHVNSGSLLTADDVACQFDRILVCGGADFHSLFPELYRAAGLKLCKLQMLKTVPSATRLGPHLASGLTLRHYGNFSACPSLPALRQRIAAETPELDRFGIHVMVSQTDSGHFILGDSHEYDEAIEPYDKSLIDELMLRELKRVFRLPDWTLVERWHGIYAKHPELPVVELQPRPGVFVRTGTGGSGMTMAFGLAEMDWEQWT